ncbi:hypothetical protein K443DRAFT_147283 [Laccaria amethystina LaAM-08-1]|uniref:Sodium/calcium exchanger membrane region domain-containing protein n=1 Tax=Laccaria amethystina LaAM-08-1 TaxID=1095629 RepID=A0A0C9XZJ8_9AGAR|nr:hypothetical protein K443DRAFT_147283 [Laccaria amethystina LaAM-08-1]
MAAHPKYQRSLSESNIERDHELYPQNQCPELRFSAISSASGSNLMLQDGTIENGLPSFYPSGTREGVPRKKGATPSIGRAWTGHLQGWRVILFGSWLNVLLFFIPVSWTLNVMEEKIHSLIFTFCILALIPLVRLHDLATKELANRIGGAKTGLLNASMSNLVEMVVGISALRKCELRVVQSSLVGSILSKLLLVLGLCFLAGGMRFSEQGFDATATQVHSSLLSISVGAVLLPAAYHFALNSEHKTTSPALQKRSILHMSHGVSIVLLCIYACYLLFQLWSHTHLYNDEHNKKSSRLPVAETISKERAALIRNGKARIATFVKTDSMSDIRRMIRDDSTTSLTPPRRPYASPLSSPSEVTLANPGSVSMSRVNTVSSGASTESSTVFGDDEGGETPREQAVDSLLPKKKQPQLSWALTIILLLTVTAAVAVSADWLVESMDRISTTISKEWVALILLPGVSSIAECLTAVRVSVKDELTLSIGVAVGSTIQTALFVIPFMVILAWIMGKPLSLLMDPFQSLVLYISVQTMNYVVADGKSNWLEGMILVCKLRSLDLREISTQCPLALYVIIGVAFWFYPGSDPLEHLSRCPVSG